MRDEHSIQDNSTNARMARIEERQKWVLRELQEICSTLNSPDGIVSSLSKRVNRLEYYLAMAIGGGVVIAWTLDKAIERILK